MEKKNCFTCKYFMAHYIKANATTYIKLPKSGHCVCHKHKVLIFLEKSAYKNKFKSCQFWEQIVPDDEQRDIYIKETLENIEMHLAAIEYMLLENETMEE